MSLLGNLLTKGKFTDSPNERTGWVWLAAIIITAIQPPFGYALITLTLYVAVLAFLAGKALELLALVSRSIDDRLKEGWRRGERPPRPVPAPHEPTPDENFQEAHRRFLRNVRRIVDSEMDETAKQEMLREESRVLEERLRGTLE